MSTINKEEIQKFSNLADEWWDVNGKFKPLHMFNPIRIEYILDEVSKHFKKSKKKYLKNKGIEIHKELLDLRKSYDSTEIKQLISLIKLKVKGKPFTGSTTNDSVLIRPNDGII